MVRRKTAEASLVGKTSLRVRFSEVDSMNVVWHGEYVRYFEDGRESFGEHYHMTYMDVFAAGYVIPIVEVSCQFKYSLHVGDHATIETRYINTPAAKIKFEYAIYKEPEHILAATGSSMQVFMRKDTNELELSTPDFYLDWKKKWNILDK